MHQSYCTKSNEFCDQCWDSFQFKVHKKSQNRKCKGFPERPSVWCEIFITSFALTLTGDAFIENHDIIHNLEIFLRKHLEEDPKSNCRMISEGYSYKECFENEIMTKFRDLIGCIPPWFTLVRGDVCFQSLNISRKEQEYVSDIFFDLYAGTLQINCLEPKIQCWFIFIDSKVSSN